MHDFKYRFEHRRSNKPPTEEEMRYYQLCVEHALHCSEQWKAYKNLCDSLRTDELLLVIDFTTHIAIECRVQDLVIVLKYIDENGELCHQVIDYLATEQKEDTYFVQIVLQHLFGLPDVINNCDSTIAQGVSEHVKSMLERFQTLKNGNHSLLSTKLGNHILFSWHRWASCEFCGLFSSDYDVESTLEESVSLVW